MLGSMGTPVRSRPHPVKSRPDAATSVAHSPLGSFDESKFSSSSLSSWGDRFQPASVSSIERSVSSRVTPARNIRRTGSSPQAVVQLGFDVSSSKSRQSVSVARQNEHARSLLHTAFRQTIPATTLEDSIRSNIANPDTISLSHRWETARRSGTAHVLYHHLVQKAYVCAATVHGSNVRPDGSKTLDHLEETALTVSSLGLDAVAVAAALLHEVFGDTGLDESTLRSFVGDEVTDLVVGVSKASRLCKMYTEHQDLQNEKSEEKLRTTLIALGDARVMLIKLADSVQQARNLSALPDEKKALFLLAMQNIFVPVANRLGIWCFKAELEDLCFKAREPEVFARLKADVDVKLRQSQATITEFTHDAVKVLEKAGVCIEDAEGRPKSLTSIREKLRRKGLSLQGIDNLFDVLAVRIIVSSKTDCYLAQRALATRWPQQPGRDRNYIRYPKPNGYQSIHTVCLTDAGLPVEVQLRTPQMHWNAEYGIAAHWRYKEGCRVRGEGGKTAAAEDGERSAEAALQAAHDRLVVLSRMVLTYGHGLRDVRKISASEHLRRPSTLVNVTLNMMSSLSRSASTGVDAPPHASGSSASAREASVAEGGRGRGSMATRGLRQPLRRSASVCTESPAARRMSFEDFVTASLTAGPAAAALPSIYVAVCEPSGGAAIEALKTAPPDCTSSVGLLLAAHPLLRGLTPSRIVVNGVPAEGPSHPLRMGDCVEVRPVLAPDRLFAASRTALLNARRPLLALQRELFRTMTRNIKGDDAISAL